MISRIYRFIGPVLIMSEAVQACPGILYNGTQWYSLLTKSAIIKVNPITPFTASTLYDHVVSDPSIPSSGSLISNLVPSATSCGLCALSYVNDLLSLRVAGSLDVSCFQTGPTWSQSDATDLMAAPCVNSLSVPLSTFDRCSDVTYGLLTGMPVSSQCSYGDFLDIDAQYHSYAIMMNRALNLTSTSSYLGDFQTAVTKSSCGVCFSNFMGSISIIRSDLFVKSACTNIYSPDCQNLQLVRDALVRFRNCVGGYDLTNMNSPPSMCTPNEKLLVNKAYNFYAPIVTCSLTNDPRGVPGAVAAWFACIQTAKRELSSTMTSLTCRDCFLNFGSFVKNNAAAAASCTSPYSAACISAISTARNTLYICSGLLINVSPPTICPPVYYVNLQPRYQSYIPMIELAVDAGSSLGKAVGSFFNQTLNSPLANATAYMPCQSCFPSLAADLAYAFTLTPGALVDCANFYSNQCMASTIVANAINDFRICSGFPLDNTSPYTCSKNEIESIQLANIPKNLFYGMFGLGEKLLKLDQVSANMRDTFLALKEASPGTNTYMCNRCFERLFTDMANVTPLVSSICRSVDNVPVCFYKLASELTRFYDCAGFTFDFSQPPVNQVSIVVPTLNLTSDTSNNITGLKDGAASSKYARISSFEYLILIAILILVT